MPHREKTKDATLSKAKPELVITSARPVRHPQRTLDHRMHMTLKGIASTSSPSLLFLFFFCVWGLVWIETQLCLTFRECSGGSDQHTFTRTTHPPTHTQYAHGQDTQATRSFVGSVPCNTGKRKPSLPTLACSVGGQRSDTRSATPRHVETAEGGGRAAQLCAPHPVRQP